MDPAARFGGLQEIGSGAFGVVYRAFDMQLSRYVALKKLMGRGNGGDEQMLKDVQKEHALMAKLSHENIVAVHDCLLEDDAAFIVLEWMPSGTVNDLIREHGRLHEWTVRKFSLDLLRGLQYLHDHGVIHHDIKPGNMLVNAEGTVKLSDFGTSKQVSQGSSGTTKNLTGTVRFMCPQGIENPRHTRATDIWALACSLTTMLSGQLPWADSIPPSADDMVPVIFHIGRQVPPNHHPFIPEHVSRELREILTRMFAFAPKDRPAAGEVLQDPYFVAAAANQPLPDSAEPITEYAESVGGSSEAADAQTFHDFTFGSTIDSNASTFLNANTYGSTVTEQQGIVARDAAELPSEGHMSVKLTTGTVGQAPPSVPPASSHHAKHVRSKVDPASGMQDTCHVYQNDDGRPMKCMLNQVDVAANSSKFYAIQLLETNEGGEYHLFTRSGRVGAAGKIKLEKQKSLHSAKSQFYKKFLDKTDNDWNGLPHFEKVEGKYQFVDIASDEEDDDSTSSSGSSNSSSSGDDVDDVVQPSQQLEVATVQAPARPGARLGARDAVKDAIAKKLERSHQKGGRARRAVTESILKKMGRLPADDSALDVQTTTARQTDGPSSPSEVSFGARQMMQLLRNPEETQALMSQLQLDTMQMPLDKINKKALDLAADVLQLIANEVKERRPNRVILTVRSSEFYELIPHNFKAQKPPVIADASMVKQKWDTLEILNNVVVATKLLKEEQSSSPPAPQVDDPTLAPPSTPSPASNQVSSLFNAPVPLAQEPSLHDIEAEDLWQELFMSMLQPFYIDKYVAAKEAGVLALPETQFAESLNAKKMRPGDVVECLDSCNKWYDATVLDVDTNENVLRIHFNCWGTSWDEHIPTFVGRMALMGNNLQTALNQPQQFINAAVRPFRSHVQPPNAIPWLELFRRTFPMLPGWLLSGATVSPVSHSTDIATLFESRFFEKEAFDEFFRETVERIAIAVPRPNIPPEVLPDAGMLPDNAVSVQKRVPVGSGPETSFITHIRAFAIMKPSGEGVFLLRYGPTVSHYNVK